MFENPILADEALVTGMLGGVAPVTRVDGRIIGDGRPGVCTRRAAELYMQAVLSPGNTA